MFEIGFGRIFGDTEPVKRFESKKRETFLDDLAFARVVRNQ
jgi:hypothetical protein